MRLRAANDLLVSATSSDTAQVQKALQIESVPRIRTVLKSVLTRLSRLHPDRPPDVAVSATRHAGSEAILQSLSGMIEHELSAATGWIEYTASKAIDNYDETEVRRAIEALKRRVRGLVAITQANQVPRMLRVSLSETIASSIPPEFPASAGVVDGEHIADSIVTDPNLLALVLINALQNAYESAAVTANKHAVVHISHGVSDVDFWISISNPYVGAPFSIEDVEATGVSSKSDHRGLGLRVILTASAALGYDVVLIGTGQVASFRLRGPRSHHA